MASCDPMESPSGRACEVSMKRWRLRMASRMRAMTAAVLSRVTELASLGLGMGCRRVWLGLGGVVGGCRACLGRPAGAFLLEVAEDLLDPIVLLDALVEEEVQLG